MKTLIKYAMWFMMASALYEGVSGLIWMWYATDHKDMVIAMYKVLTGMWIVMYLTVLLRAESAERHRDMLLDHIENKGKATFI